jgi:hypothetical protein
MTNKTDGDILDNAPEGATHYSWETYCKANKDFFYDWNGEEWCAYFVPDGDMRSLADIEALITKDNHIAELEEKVKVLTFISHPVEYDGHVHNVGLVAKTMIDKKDKRIAELEKEKQVLIKQHDMWKQQWHELNDSLAIRDLEQQANGAEDVIESVLGEPETLTSDALSIRYEFLDRLKQLREQVKGGAN